MAQDPLTPFLGLTKPVVNDPDGEDLWGQKLNINFDLIDAYSASLGQAVTEAPQDGKVYGRGTPTTWVPAAPLDDYNDSLIAAQDKNAQQDTAIAAKEPIIAPGAVTDFWRGDKQWTPLSSITVDAWTKAQSDARYEPIDTMYTKAESDARYEPFDSAYTKAESDVRYEPFDSAYTKAESAALYEPKITAGTPTQYWAGDKTWKAFPPQVGLVDVGDTPPVSPIDKQLFWESDSGILMLRYNDGTGASQWVQVNNPAGLTKVQGDMAYLPLTGGTLSGWLDIKAAGWYAGIGLDATDGTSGASVSLLRQGKYRWDVQSGGDPASHFYINRYNDAGTYIDQPLTINRATGATTLSGDLTISKASAFLTLNKAASGQNSSLLFQTNGLTRWNVKSDGVGAETGGNAGSDFVINAHSDAGAFVANAITINRATGVVTATGLPPTPKNGVGIGQATSQTFAINTAATLPAGGSWWWFSYGLSSTGTVTTALWAGVGAGGTAVLGATASVAWQLCMWRIA